MKFDIKLEFNRGGLTVQNNFGLSTHYS